MWLTRKPTCSPNPPHATYMDRGLSSRLTLICGGLNPCLKATRWLGGETSNKPEFVHFVPVLKGFAWTVNRHPPIFCRSAFCPTCSLLSSAFSTKSLPVQILNGGVIKINDQEAFSQAQNKETDFLAVRFFKQVMNKTTWFPFGWETYECWREHGSFHSASTACRRVLLCVTARVGSHVTRKVLQMRVL